MPASKPDCLRSGPCKQQTAWVAQAKARKAEATTKLAELQIDIQRLGELSQEQVEAEEAAARQLHEAQPQPSNPTYHVATCVTCACYSP